MIYPDAREFFFIVDAVAVLIEETSFIVSSDGVRIRALDPSRTAMVDLFIPREAFEEYPSNVEGDVRIGVNFDDFKKLLSRVKKGDRLSIEALEGKLRVRLLGKASRVLNLPLIDIGAEQLPTPKVVFTVLAKIASDSFKEALKDAEVVADAVKLEARDDGLYMRASSDRGDVEIKFEREGEAMFEYDLKESASSKYSLDYLIDISSRAYKISDILTLEFATQKPISLTFEIPMGGRLTYYVAPMLE